jgi:hypothetical protein
VKALIVLVLLAVGGTALAQETGGTMGGGDWGGGGDSGGGGGGGGGWGGGDSSPSWDHDSGWSSKHSDHSSSFFSHDDDKPKKDGVFDPVWDHTPGEYKFPEINWHPHTEWLLYVGVGITALIVLVLFANLFRRDGYRPSPALGDDYYIEPATARPGEVDVSVLRVAIDGRARKFIQTELKEIATTCDTATAVGRAAMLAEVTLLVRRVRDAWVYGGAFNEPMGALASAKQRFDRHVDDERTRFARETVTNVQGQKARQDAGELTRRSDEGEGLILVSIILAARTELFTISAIADGEDLRKALEAASYLTADQLVAVDVVWMPAEENDRMSSVELEAKYPRPELIPIRGALVGKTFCAYCAGPFPAELVSCPHCGAPATGRAA